jgi:hypothetical protein
MGDVLAGTRRELAAIRRERDERGWSESLAGRALAASRVVAACALGRGVAHDTASDGPHAPDGSFVVRRGILRKTPVRVSSSVTADHVARDLARLPESEAGDRRHLLETLRDALTTLTSTQYGQRPAVDDGALDEALASSIEAVRRVKREHSWPGKYASRRAAPAAARERRA